MPKLSIRRSDECRYDAVALGEVMLRLDPGDERIRTASTLRVWEGGGEYNVIRGLSRVFGLRTAVATALVDNEVGRLVESNIMRGGVDTALIKWVPFDGVGRSARNGLNFTERGFGVRRAVGVSDRANTAISLTGPGEFDFDELFGSMGVRWFHTGGIMAGLSATAASTVLQAVRSARRHGTVVSYDLNFRASLWKGAGGSERAQEVNRSVVEHVDVVLGNEEDFSAALGFDVDGADVHAGELPVESFGRMAKAVASEFPSISVVATTLRTVRSASTNDWKAIAWSREDGLVRSVERLGLEIYDRVGGGDSFASGLLYGLLTGQGLATAVDYGAAHGALAMTTPGDTSAADLSDVIRLAEGGSARVDR